MSDSTADRLLSLHKRCVSNRCSFVSLIIKLTELGAMEDRVEQPRQIDFYQLFDDQDGGHGPWMEELKKWIVECKRDGQRNKI